MEKRDSNEKKKIFMYELHKLAEKRYISGKQFNEMARAHQQYYHDLMLKEGRKNRDTEIKIDPVVEEQVLETRTVLGSDVSPELTPNEKPVITPIQSSVTSQSQNLDKVQKPIQSPKIKPQMKKISPEDLRERNITWLLSLGVILLLIGGLYLATSNWETMSSVMKSGLVGLVSLLFFGIAYFSQRVLKIEKTGFAFFVLGSLFLPIFLLSIGWFKLLGDYLSLTGEGRDLFGLISSFLLVPFYISFARMLKARLFVWFSFIAMAVGVAFSLSAINLELDWFYFGIMLYNVLAVFLFHRFKNKDSFKLFTKELVPFAQIQLVVSSLLTIVFFDNHVINGLNILLSAAVYLAMVFVSGKKEYHFIFSTMIVYGAYQLIEHSVLDVFGPVLYVLIAIGFLILPRLLDGQAQWKKIFTLTSAIVSGIVFLSISMEAIIINMGEPSWALLLAYLLLAGQFVYLANEVKNRLFAYLGPVFLLVTFFEAILLIDQYVYLESLILSSFIIGFLLFISFGYFIKKNRLVVIQKSSRDVAYVQMLFVLLLSQIFSSRWEIGLMFCLLGLTFYLSHRVEDRAFYKMIVPWMIPVSFALAFVSFGEEWRSLSYFYYQNLGLAMSAVLGSIVSFIGFYVWIRLKEAILAKSSFFIGQAFYSLAIFYALLFQINEIWMKPLVLLIGITVYLAFYRKEKFQWLPYGVGLLSLVWYFTALQSIYLLINVPEELQSLEYTFAATLLLAISYLLKNHNQKLAEAFTWIGHLYLPFALLLSVMAYYEISIWSFLIATIIYAFTTYLVQAEWKTKLGLYATFFTLFWTIISGLEYTGLHWDISYVFLSTSGLIAGFWLLANPDYKQRTMYYFVPFSLIGIISFTLVYPYTLTSYLVTVGYAIVLLIFLSKQKWNLIFILPTLLIYVATTKYVQFAELAMEINLLILALIGAGMILAGQLFHHSFIQKDDKNLVTNIDGFTIIAFLFFGSSYEYRSELLILTYLVPGLLISIGLWLQKARVPEDWSMWLKIAAGVYLLEPYYSTVSWLTIPDLWEREVYVLPWIAVVVFLQRCTGEKYSKYMNYLQWAVLVLISLALVEDGLASNTIYDALILGTLSLISMLVGMYLRNKAYFIVGSGVLLLNVFLQTRPFWGNLPWWMYLLISGSILISVASYNEWHKQKAAKGEDTLLSVTKEKLKSWFNNWD